jgi:hypothetical protein
MNAANAEAGLSSPHPPSSLAFDDSRTSQDSPRRSLPIRSSQDYGARIYDSDDNEDDLNYTSTSTSNPKKIHRATPSASRLLPSAEAPPNSPATDRKQAALRRAYTVDEEGAAERVQTGVKGLLASARAFLQRNQGAS